MTQAVTNTLNNIEQMVSTQSTFQKTNESVATAMDKFKDFTKVFESTLKKESSTIEDVKSKLPQNDIEIQENLIASAEFKEALQKATDEANTETSLDLTLAKDINEIISELKEAIENTTEIIEENSEKENSGEIIVDSDVSNIIDETLNTEELGGTTSTDIEGTQSNEQNQKMPFEQIITFADKSLSALNNTNETAQAESDSLNIAQEQVELSSEEILEFAENISDEVITIKNTTEDDYEELELNIDEEIIKELNIESISSQTESFSGDSLMQNQTPEEQAVKAVLNQDIEGVESFEIKIDSNQNLQNSQQLQIKPIEINPSKIIDQISKQLEGLQNNSKVNIVLNPESLGKVNVQLMTTKEGITAQFIVTTQEAKDLISKGLDGLKEALGNQGVTVDNVSVKIADSQKSEYKQDWTEQEGSNSGNKGQKQPNREEKEKGLFEKMMAQTTEEENGNV